MIAAKAPSDESTGNLLPQRPAELIVVTRRSRPVTILGDRHRPPGYGSKRHCDPQCRPTARPRRRPAQRPRCFTPGDRDPGQGFPSARSVWISDGYDLATAGMG
jgi:hypothetical protein